MNENHEHEQTAQQIQELLKMRKGHEIFNFNEISEILNFLCTNYKLMINYYL
jgi:hypothetical protein